MTESGKINLKAVNYCPVSLKCITRKLFEHIISKRILAHFEDHTILTDLQHGFFSLPHNTLEGSYGILNQLQVRKIM